MEFKKVAVLMGGTSNERNVSLQSGSNVVEALSSLGKYEVVGVQLDSDDLSCMPADVDAVFLALHGGYGENGGVQTDLDGLSIPYTGPGAAASKVTIDKIETKKVLDEAGVPNAPWCVVGPEALEASPLPLPVVVKPPKDGSSVGISRVAKPEEWRGALELALKVDREANGGEGRALVEAFIPGREWTVGIIDGEVLPVIEIQAPGGWYGYEEKYVSDVTKYVFPEDEETACDKTSCGNSCAGCSKGYDLKAAIAQAQKFALAAWNAVGCRGVTRVDFRVSPEGMLYVLELNTVPGFTAHSLVPKAAARIGISFPDLCDRILKAASHD